MIASFVIMLREGIEAALVIGIIAAYLAKLGRRDLNKFLYLGTGAAVIASIVVALIFKTVYGGADKNAQELLEGIAMLTAVAVLTYMIFWMSKHGIKQKVQTKVDTAISNRQLFGISFLAFISVFREGVESVLFLSASALSSFRSTVIGAALGLVVVILIAIQLNRAAFKLDHKKFFRYTSVVLIFFAAGLVGRATLEFQALGILPGTISVADTSAILSETSVLGSILQALLGYTSQPSLLQVIFHLAYLFLAFYLFFDLTHYVFSSEREYGDPFMPLGLDYNHKFYKIARKRIIPNLLLYIMGILALFLIAVLYFGIDIGPFNNQGPLRIGAFKNPELPNNIGSFAIWVMFLPLMTILILFFGRFWCGNLCPLGGSTVMGRYVGEKIFGRDPNPTPYIRAGFMLPMAFLLISFISVALDITGVAKNTAYLFIFLFLSAFLVGFFFHRRSWCRYVCPIGAWFGVVNRLSIIGLRSKQKTCENCTTKECIKGIDAGMCPTFLNPSKLSSNRHCLECWKCIKNCPKEKSSMKIGFRVPGAELLRPYAPDIWESTFIVALVGMFLADAVGEAGAFGFLNRFEFLGSLDYAVLFTGFVMLGITLHITLSGAASYLGGVPYREGLTNFGYVFMPLVFGIGGSAFGSFAFELLNISVAAMAVLIGGGYIWSLILAVSILDKHSKSHERAALALVPVGLILTLIFLQWLQLFASGTVIDLT